MTDRRPEFLTTAECADRLGVTTAFVIGEIHDRRLAALRLSHGRRRSMYRIRADDFAAYLAKYWRRVGDPNERNE